MNIINNKAITNNYNYILLSSYLYTSGQIYLCLLYVLHEYILIIISSIYSSIYFLIIIYQLSNYHFYFMYLSILFIVYLYNISKCLYSPFIKLPYSYPKYIISLY